MDNISQTSLKDRVRIWLTTSHAVGAQKCKFDPALSHSTVPDFVLARLSERLGRGYGICPSSLCCHWGSST